MYFRGTTLSTMTFISAYWKADIELCGPDTINFAILHIKISYSGCRVRQARLLPHQEAAPATAHLTHQTRCKGAEALHHRPACTGDGLSVGPSGVFPCTST